MRRARATAMLALILLVACGDVRAAREDAQRTEIDIKNDLGIDSDVSFRIFSTAKGKTLSVSVHLKGTASGDLDTLKARIGTIVSRDFRTHVDRLSVAF